jgi:hypothetical protein
MRSFMEWIKSNLKYVGIGVLLLVMAAISLSYAYLSAGNRSTVAVALQTSTESDLERLPLAEELPADSQASNGDGTAVLGANSKCKENEIAMTAVNLKMHRELQNHEGIVKEIGHGGFMSKVLRDRRLNEEEKRHQSAMKLLQAQYQSLLDQLNC